MKKATNAAPTLRQLAVTILALTAATVGVAGAASTTQTHTQNGGAQPMSGVIGGFGLE